MVGVESPLTVICNRIKSLSCSPDGYSGAGFPFWDPEPVPLEM